jgi:hypothetical protein
LGLLLYEMLAGGPAFPYHLKRDQRVIRDVLAVPPAALRRADLRNLPDLAEQSIQRNANSRPQSVAAFAQSLQRSLPPIPAERKKFQINWKVVLMILGSLLLISLLIVFASAIVQ